MKQITLAHGSGGINSAALTQEVFMPFFQSLMPYPNEDSAIFELANNHNQVKQGVTSTDCYTINPIFFAGGDIGKLSVCGSSNDVAMMGGKPLYLNIGFIIEEGFEIALLKKIAQSIAHECEKLDLKILSADTKVLPQFNKQIHKDTHLATLPQTDKTLFIATTCIGVLEKSCISANNLQHDDCIILSGKVGNHGARIFLEQNNISLDSDIQSDCASLYPMLAPLFQSNIAIHALRDATRGGLSSVLNEWAISSKACIEINEDDIKVDSQVYGVCEILGLEPYDLANEGVCVLAVAKECANDVLQILRQHELGKNAQIIGKVSKNFSSNPNDKRLQDSIESTTLNPAYFRRVVLHTKYGSKRFLEYPQGELLPRIC